MASLASIVPPVVFRRARFLARPAVGFFLLALAFPTASESRAASATKGADSKQAALVVAVEKVYDTKILHHIEISIPPEDVVHVGTMNTNRARATVTFDGTVLKEVGIRQSGGVWNLYRSIDGKPSLSLKFDDFVKGQNFHGLNKISLKAEYQDLSLMNEHLTYEVFRRAGIAAPMTAHAVVTINGVVSGIYLMREPIDKQFLLRNFGKENEGGNLYEFDVTMNHGDFVVNPGAPELKDELAEARSRDDLINLASAVKAAPPELFAAAVSPLADLDRYATFFAVEAVTSDMDGFSFHNNNSLMYDLPRDHRFVFIPYGADEAFWATGTQATRISSPFQRPGATFAIKFLASPAMNKKFQDEVARVGGDAVWDEKALLARVAEVGRILATAEKVGRTAEDLALFERNRPVVEEFIRAGGVPGMRPRRLPPNIPGRILYLPGWGEVPPSRGIAFERPVGDSLQKQQFR